MIVFFSILSFFGSFIYLVLYFTLSDSQVQANILKSGRVKNPTQKDIKDERNMYFSLIFILLILGFFLQYCSYQEKAEEKAKIEKAEKDSVQAQAQNKILEEKKEVQTKIKKDSITYYLKKSDTFLLSNDFKRSLLEIDRALSCAIGIDFEKTDIYHKKADILLKSGDREYASNIYDIYLSKDEQGLIKGIKLYFELGKKKEGFEKIKELRSQNTTQADILYNQYNPIVKTFVGYTTLCCDGTTSSATGRGACSHHGGVCGQQPVYSENRVYMEY